MTIAEVRTAVRFRVNGRAVASEVPGGTRLLDVLRSGLGLTGTKEGCGEGECGACSVLVDGQLVASCLVPVAQADGSDVVTVEALGGAGPDPLQGAFLDTGAVQCGFCTPGMLLAARAWLDRGEPASEAAIREAIAGNLCRCTGYTKIVEAVARAAESWPPSSGAPRGPGGGDGHEDVVAGAGGVAGSAPEVISARSLDEALERLEADGELRPLAGGTDVMVELSTGGRRRDGRLLDLWHIDELRGIRLEEGEVVLGALTTFEDLRASAIVAEHLPVLAEMAASVGAVQVRSRGTLGGNVATASPAGDSLPVLLATDATFEVAGRRARRRIPASSFWTAYRTTELRPGELLVAIRIPLVAGRRARFRKLGTRRAQAISKVVVAVAWREDAGQAAGGPRTWRDVRVALGSVAPVPMRAPRTEALLEGVSPSPELADRAAEVVRTEISPIDDVRSTAAYRREVTGRMLRRIVLEAAAGPEAVPGHRS